jgi:hypothetical protein
LALSYRAKEGFAIAVSIYKSTMIVNDANHHSHRCEKERERQRGSWPSHSQIHDAVCSDLAISSCKRVLLCKMHAKSTQNVLEMMILIH